MEIVHRPIFEVAHIIEKIGKTPDGQTVEYVCTTSLHGNNSLPMDIFYRKKKHPEYGNRYFGIYTSPIGKGVMITDADSVEKLEFKAIKDKEGNYHYSSYAYDRIEVDGMVVDGGRDKYTWATIGTRYTKFIVRDGDFIQIGDEK